MLASSPKRVEMPTSKPPRAWQVIAKELVEEKDMRKIVELSEELTRALDNHSGKQKAKDTTA
jgi:hypothetical protein